MSDRELDLFIILKKQTQNTHFFYGKIKMVFNAIYTLCIMWIFLYIYCLSLLPNSLFLDCNLYQMKIHLGVQDSSVTIQK